MSQIKNVKLGRTVIGCLDKNADLLRGLCEVCREHDIRAARISCVGSVQRAVLGYYDQGIHHHHEFDVIGPMEISGFTAILFPGEEWPAIHGSISLSDIKGRTYGGRLREGIVVFSCEYIIQELTGDNLWQEIDPRTGLMLFSPEHERPDSSG